MFVGGGVIGLMFMRRARIMAGMLRGEDVIASFHYPEHLLQKVAEDVKQERQEKNIIRFMFITIIVVFVALFVIILLLIDKSHAAIGPILLVFLALEAAMYATARLSPASAYNKILKSKGQVVIGSAGLLFCGEFHVWKAFRTKLNHVYLEEKKKKKSLCFRYSYYVSHLPPVKNTFEVSIPLFDLEYEEITQKVFAYF